MTGKNFDYVRSCVENEGFDNTFAHYTDFKEEVTDKKFHVLREKFLKARMELAEYCGLTEFAE